MAYQTMDYVLTHTQAAIEKDLCMKIPKGFEVNKGCSDNNTLKLHKNFYGQKQAGRVWNKYSVDKLVNKLRFKQSKIDECVLY
jgi:hypothetical protein